MESEGLDPAGYCTPEEVEELIIDLYWKKICLCYIW
jgi:hypothetical protein